MYIYIYIYIYIYFKNFDVQLQKTQANTVSLCDYANMFPLRNG